ncbi:hypothetical protein [Fructobacillus americanaquae]|uniref:HIRAN domain-containing protein n=1 Tax=Fructobacillus americanaquae TaxID=2940302 RepID=A0ABY5C2B9_9LACO|nr:hypothetical protein [Fructobacillus americanaquae]USS91993.1 hypothetical protein M3M36_06695 [Fructobacillus americanaquae]
MPFIYLLILLVFLFWVVSFIFSFWGILIMVILGSFFLIGYLSPDQKEKRRLKKENNNSYHPLNEESDNEDKDFEREKTKPKILGFNSFDHIESTVNSSPKTNVSNKGKVKVVGTTYTDADKILRNIVKDKGGLWNTGGYTEHDIFLSLVPDPDNKVDPNAIAVYSRYETPERARISRSGRIGYLPKGIGLVLDEETIVKAEIKEGYGKFGVTVDLSELKFTND